MLSLNLDRKNDILYMGFSDTGNSYGAEVANGLVVLHDLLTDDITGVTIFDFFKRYQNGTLGKLPIPVTIDFDKDVCQKLNM